MSTNVSLNEVYLDVALECQRRIERIAKQFGEGERTEEVERALDYALFSTRTDKGDLQKNLGDVLMNGRHSVRRSRARRAAAVTDAARLAKQGVATGTCAGFATHEAPEDLAVAGELLEHLRDEASRCGRHGTRVLAGLIDGESAVETAKAARVSKATVDRTIRRLRTAATAGGHGKAA